VDEACPDDEGRDENTNILQEKRKRDGMRIRKWMHVRCGFILKYIHNDIL
jgi:hypothetical protein